MKKRTALCVVIALVLCGCARSLLELEPEDRRLQEIMESSWTRQDQGWTLLHIEDKRDDVIKELNPQDKREMR